MNDRPVAGYYRVSQARDGMHAPELYETEIRRYCTYKNLTLARTYSDIDYSAFRGAKQRPSLTELVEARHDYSAVVIPKLSRFGRSMKEVIRLFDVFDTDGIPLVFLDMNLDTSTSQGRLLRHILAAFAEYESDVKSDYTRANIRRAAEAGRPHGYIAPFGYSRVGKGDTATLAIDEPRAAIVREVFERYACGEGFSSIGRDLDARGLRGLKGGRWAREQIRLLIDQQAYVGLRRHGTETFHANWPPIVTRKLWEEVQARRDANRQTWRAPRSRGLLSGLLYCGICDRKLTCGLGEHGIRLYKCNTGRDLPPRCAGGSIRMTRVDGLVVDAAGQMLGLVVGREMRDRSSRWPGSWQQASGDDRRVLLAEVVERVTLLPRPVGNPHGRGQPIGRTIRIVWRYDWSVAAFGHSGASSTLTPRDTSITSPQGKSWDEWRRQRLLPK